MAKKKKSKKRSPQRNTSTARPHAGQSPVGFVSSRARGGSDTPAISQCMIVKNEEKNIERALSWGKDLLAEQIVVDTGSTDRTVELAESMGAKVFHFEWIDDFAAAKNYAIEQATGDWIVVLDADEYFEPEDAKKLVSCINSVHADPKLRNKHKIIGCSLYNITEKGEAISISNLTRVFQNSGEFRYKGRVHEAIYNNPNDVLWVSDIKIIHITSPEIRAELGKVERNIKLIRAELAENPQNLQMKGYLAEALVSTEKEEAIIEAENLFNELIAEGDSQKAGDMITRRAYNYFIVKNAENPQKLEYCKDLCLRAMKIFPGWLDYDYFHTIILNGMGEHKQALELAMQVEKKLANEKSLANSEIISAKPYMLHVQCLMAAQKLQDTEKVLKYAALILSKEKNLTGILGPYIVTQLNNGKSTDELTEMLGSLYNLNDPQDLLIIARAAKDYGAIQFARQIVAMAGERRG